MCEAMNIGDRVRYQGRYGRVNLLMGPVNDWQIVQIELEPYSPIHGEMVRLDGEDIANVERVEPQTNTSS